MSIQRSAICPYKVKGVCADGVYSDMVCPTNSARLIYHRRGNVGCVHTKWGGVSIQSERSEHIEV